MTKLPYFPLYASDWLGSNKRAAMTLAEQGAYMNLLCRQWTDETCSLPDDDEELLGLAGVSSTPNGRSTDVANPLPIRLQVVRKAFPKHPTLSGRIANPRMLQEWEKAVAKSAAASKAGKASGRKRKRRKELGSTTRGERTLNGRSTDAERNGNETGTNQNQNQSNASTSVEAYTQTPLDQAFECWFRTYPSRRRGGRDACRKAWNKARKRIEGEGATRQGAIDLLQERVMAFAQSPKGKGNSPMPSRWLNEGRWNDDPAAWEQSDEYDRRRKTGYADDSGSVYQG